jgi:predicted NUDIX family NTP pyrophosphohydrolase
MTKTEEKKEKKEYYRKQYLAGVLLYKVENKDIYVYLVKSGAPWHKDRPFPWGISKGKLDKNEGIIDGAVRESHEETGAEIDPKKFKDLGAAQEIAPIPVTKEVVNKILYIFAQYYDKEIEYTSPENIRPYNGSLVKYPEISEAKWFKIEDAYENIRPVQKVFLDRLKELVNGYNV